MSNQKPTFYNSSCDATIIITENRMFLIFKDYACNVQVSHKIVNYKKALKNFVHQTCAKMLNRHSWQYLLRHQKECMKISNHSKIKIWKTTFQNVFKSIFFSKIK